jgi:hypothetical protein
VLDGPVFFLLAAALTLGNSAAFAGPRDTPYPVTPYPVPAIAKQHGFTNPVLYETWKNGTSTIDVNNTKDAGFNWYVNGYFPVQNNWWLSGFNTKTAATASQFSVSNGVLTYYDGGASNPNTLISSCVWNGSTVIGSSYGGGLYLDVAISFNPAIGGTNNAYTWPAVWMVPVEFLNGGTGVSGHVIDTSVFEAAPTTSSLCTTCAPQVGTHDEQVGQKTNPPQQTPFVTSTMIAAFGSFDFNQPHHYQYLWVPQAKNGGSNGVMAWWIDGVPMFTITYSNSGLSHPDLVPSGGVGELSYTDGSHFCLFIDPGTPVTNQPINVGIFQVWQAPAGTTAK